MVVMFQLFVVQLHATYGAFCLFVFQPVFDALVLEIVLARQFGQFVAGFERGLCNGAHVLGMDGRVIRYFFQARFPTL